MKTLLIIAIVFICGSLKQDNRQACQLVQRLYLHGKLVHTQSYDKGIKDYGGGVSTYIVSGKKVMADSIVTTLK